MQSNQKNQGTSQSPEKSYPQTEKESDNRVKQSGSDMNREKDQKQTGNEDPKKGNKFQK